MSDLLWALLAMAGLAVLLYLTTRIEPHWVSRDGRRMRATAQYLDDRAMPCGRPFGARIVVTSDDLVLVRRRGPRGGDRAWQVDGRSPDPPARQQIYVLRPANGDGGDLLMVRLPASSRAVAVLDQSTRGAGASRVGPPGTWRSDRRPDRG